jgi:hypothetical protein
MPEATHVTVLFTADEALVLFDLLHRWEASGAVSSPEHAAEQVVLWNLSALLEGQLSEPFEARYSELVSSARARLASPGVIYTSGRPQRATPGSGASSALCQERGRSAGSP